MSISDTDVIRVWRYVGFTNSTAKLKQALQNYNTNAEERIQSFEALKEKDQKSARTIEDQMKKLQKLQENVALIKAKMAVNARECEERNRSLREVCNIDDVVLLDYLHGCVL